MIRSIILLLGVKVVFFSYLKLVIQKWVVIIIFSLSDSWGALHPAIPPRPVLLVVGRKMSFFNFWQQPMLLIMLILLRSATIYPSSQPPIHLGIALLQKIFAKVVYF